MKLPTWHCCCQKKQFRGHCNPRELWHLILILECATQFHQIVLQHTIFYSDSDIARAARFFHPVVNLKKDHDSDSVTEKTSSKLSHEDITIKERYNKVWQGSEVVVVVVLLLLLLLPLLLVIIMIIIIIIIIIIISIFLSCTCSCFVYVLF